MSAVLKLAGHTTELLYLESLVTELLCRRISPDTKLIAVSATTDQYDLARKVIGFISRRFDIPIILGGVHATVAPEESIQTAYSHQSEHLFSSESERYSELRDAVF